MDNMAKKYLVEISESYFSGMYRGWERFPNEDKKMIAEETCNEIREMLESEDHMAVFTFSPMIRVFEVKEEDMVEIKVIISKN